MAERGNTITQHQATTDTELRAAYEHAIEWSREYAKKDDRDDALLCFAISFLNGLNDAYLTEGFQVTMDKLTWEANEGTK